MNYLKYQLCLKLKPDRGFTLIELLVVVIIIGVLSAIALPNFLAQVGKARESEAKNNLGAISRAQQAYYFEKQLFAGDIGNLNISNLGNGKYYSFPDPGITEDSVRHQAVAINPTTDIVRNYAVGIYHNSGLYSTVFCQGQGVNQAVDAPNSNIGSCTNGGSQIK